MTFLELAGPFLVGFLCTLVGLTLGLWMGERGRRIDAQLREVGRPVVPPAPAKVLARRDDIVGSDDTALALQAAREKMIADCMKETGCTRETAELDVDRMMAQLYQ